MLISKFLIKNFFFFYYQRDTEVPLKINQVPAWIPPSAIKRDALTTNNNNNNFEDEETFRNVRR